MAMRSHLMWSVRWSARWSRPRWSARASATTSDQLYWQDLGLSVALSVGFTVQFAVGFAIIGLIVLSVGLDVGFTVVVGSRVDGCVGGRVYLGSGMLGANDVVGNADGSMSLSTFQWWSASLKTRWLAKVEEY